MTRLAHVLPVLVASVAWSCSSPALSPAGPTTVLSGGTQPVCTAPPPATTLDATLLPGGVRLTWSPSSGAVDYVVLVGTSPAASNVLLTGTTELYYELSAMEAGMHYARVHSHNWCGTSTPSNDVEFSVFPQ